MFGDGEESCEGSIIQAHTVQRARHLESISEAGHVLGYKLDGASFLNSPDGTVEPKKIGLRKASTFHGFCEHHDKELFRIAEDDPFTIQTEKIGAVSYRALCREQYMKEASVVHSQKMIGLVGGSGDFDDQRMRGLQLAMYAEANESGLRALLREKVILEKMLVDGEWSDLRWVAIDVPGQPFFAASSVWAAERTVDGLKLQDLETLGVDIDYIFGTAVPAEGSTVFLFAWRAGAQASAEFASSLTRVERSELASVCLRAFLLNAENVYYRPSWWAGLTPDAREAIQNLMFKEGSQFASRDRPLAGKHALPLHTSFGIASAWTSTRAG